MIKIKAHAWHQRLEMLYEAAEETDRCFRRARLHNPKIKPYQASRLWDVWQQEVQQLGDLMRAEREGRAMCYRGEPVELV